MLNSPTQPTPQELKVSFQSFLSYPHLGVCAPCWCCPCSCILMFWCLPDAEYRRRRIYHKLGRDSWTFRRYGTERRSTKRNLRIWFRQTITHSTKRNSACDPRQGHYCSSKFIFNNNFWQLLINRFKLIGLIRYRKDWLLHHLNFADRWHQLHSHSGSSCCTN